MAKFSLSSSFKTNSSVNLLFKISFICLLIFFSLAFLLDIAILTLRGSPSLFSAKIKLKNLFISMPIIFSFS